MTKRPTKTSRATAASRTKAAKQTPAKPKEPANSNGASANDDVKASTTGIMPMSDEAKAQGAAVQEVHDHAQSEVAKATGLSAEMMAEPARSPDQPMLEVYIARVCYEANRAWCAAHGDDSQPRYADAAHWQLVSIENGVRFHMANPQASASASHANWMAEKLADGWVYGEDKDPEKKTHPCIVPFDQLPEQQQAKDRMFKGIVHALTPWLASSETMLESTTMDGAPTSVLLHVDRMAALDPDSVDLPYDQDPVAQLIDLDDNLRQTDLPALKAFIAADACGELIDRATMTAWPDGALNGLISYAAEQCRAYEGVNSEALYLALEGELRKGLYWPNCSADMELDSEGRETSQPQSLLWAYDEARPDVLAWVEVFARTVDFLDQLHRDHPPAGKPTDADTEAA